jgi:hypothetical protein
MNDRLMTGTQRPYTDSRTASLVGFAIEDVIAARHPDWAGDLSLELHALASLRDQVAADLTTRVSEARRVGLDWEAIAELLGTSDEQAREDYEDRAGEVTPATD